VGGGTPRAATAGPARPDHPRQPLSLIPTPLSVIPAQAGTRATPTVATSPSPIHPSPLPGGRLGGGYEATSRRTNRTAPRSPMPHLRRARTLCHTRPSPSFLRRQEPPYTPHFPQLLLRSHQNRSAEPCLSPHNAPDAPSTPATPALPTLTKNLTEVDTRLTKVDKGCQKLTPSTPAPTPNPSKTATGSPSRQPSVNLRCQPLRRTPNKPEQP